MITIHVELDVSTKDEELSFLQTLRDWERQHPHVEIATLISAEHQTVREAEAILDAITPGFPFKRVIPR